MSNFENTINDNEPSGGKIHGWLKFFLVVVGIGGVLTPIISFATMSLSDYDTGIGAWHAVTGIICECILGIGFAFLAAYTIIAFINYKPNAVFLGKAYLILVFITNLVSLFGENESTGINSNTQILSRLIWQCAWFSFLCFSEQVNNLFPKKERRIFKRDKILIATIITPSIVWFLSVFIIAFAQGYNEQQIVNDYSIDESALSINEYTDGRIIFTLPEGFSVERQESENGIYHDLSQDDKIYITVYGVYDNDDSPEYFEEYMQGWRDETFDDFEYTVKNEKHDMLNGNSLYQKTLEYVSEPVIEWSFVLLFNKETDKCCVISYYSMSETDYLAGLVQSIRFQ